MIMHGAILVCIIHGFFFGLYSCLRSNSHYRNNKNIMNIFPPLPNSSKKKLTNAVFSITTLNPLEAFTILRLMENMVLPLLMRSIAHIRGI